ncbi:putative Ig domain-containing protein [Leptospira adleri]|nr:putative Ig domain-containing protein [Leptospira adleri]
MNLGLKSMQIFANGNRLFLENNSSWLKDWGKSFYFFLKQPILLNCRKFLILWFCILAISTGCVQGNGGSFNFKGIFGPLGLSSDLNVPISVNYSGSPYVFTKDAAISGITPDLTGNIQSCSSNPSLPSGLVLNNHCVISGTPTIAQSATNYSITASNGSAAKTIILVITVDANPPTSFAYSLSSFAFTRHASASPVHPFVTGTVTSCSSDIPLPAGLTLSSDCTITGAPTVAQPSTNYTITASNAFGNASVVISIAVNETAPTSLNYAGNPFVLTKDTPIASIIPTITGTVTSCSTDISLPSGLTINSTTCAISGTPNTVQTATNYIVTASNAFGSISRNINITVNLAPPSALNYAGGPFIFSQGATITTLNPSITGTITNCVTDIPLPVGLAINAMTCAISGTPTSTQAATNYLVTASNAFGSISTGISITVNLAPPSGLNYAGSPYVFTKDAVIATVTPTITGTVTNCTTDISLPAGLSIHSITCAISGTPTLTQGPTNYNVTASNAFGSTTQTITISVNVAPPSALNYAGSPFVFTQNATISSVTPTFTGTATSCTTDIALPTGLAIDSTTCVISGTPTVPQAATNYVVTAGNSSGNTTRTISIAVNIEPPSLLNYAGSPFTFTQGAAVTTITPAVIGTVTSCSTDIPLPAGLSVGSNCAISGTPTSTQAATNYVVTASNSSGNTTKTISIAINMPPPSGLNYAGSPFVFTKNTTIAIATPTFSGTVTSCSTDIALPAGLTINSTTCAISGTPTGIQASANYVVTASNASGSTTKTISIMVFGKPPQKTNQIQCWDGSGMLDATCSLASSLGQDGKLQNGTAASFTGPILVGASDYITVDNNSGMVWTTCQLGRTGSTCTGGSNTFYSSRANGTAACSALDSLNAGAGYGNKHGWRIPTIAELESLVDYNNSTGPGSSNPKTYTTSFPGTDAGYYFLSSDSYVPSAGAILVLYFSSGATVGSADSGSFRVRCITNGP